MIGGLPDQMATIVRDHTISLESPEERVESPEGRGQEDMGAGLTGEWVDPGPIMEGEVRGLRLKLDIHSLRHYLVAISFNSLRVACFVKLQLYGHSVQFSILYLFILQGEAS